MIESLNSKELGIPNEEVKNDSNRLKDFNEVLNKAFKKSAQNARQEFIRPLRPGPF